MKNINCKCPVCGVDAVEQPVTNYFANYYSCRRCGKFIIETDTLRLFTDSAPGPKVRACAYWYFQKISNNEEKNKPIPHIISSDWEEGHINNHQFVNVNSLLKLYPKNINEQIEMVIINMSNEISFIGGEFGVEEAHYSKVYPLFFIDQGYDTSDAVSQLDEILNILIENGLIKGLASYDNNRYYTLTAPAWSMVQEIKSKSLPQAFVAMWFDQSMVAAREKIIQAVKYCGYIPVIIDEKEYNSFIVPEILYEIENCRFVIADFTGGRGGVYYEAGYARGLKKDVIMTCKADLFNPHFDTQQINHIIWKDEEELYDRLVKRIRATVGVI